MAKRRWKPSEVRQLIELRASGMIAREIAAILGRTKDSVDCRIQYLDPNYRYYRKLHELNKARLQAAPEARTEPPVESIEEQPKYWRAAIAADQAFLTLLWRHHPDKRIGA